MEIVVKNGVKIERGVRRLGRTLLRESPSLFKVLGRVLRDDVRQRIRTQDGGKWAPLSPWTVARTAKRRPLAGQDRNIKFKVLSRRLEVYFDAPSNWDISKHHRGYTIPADGGYHSIAIKRPSALGLSPGTTRFRFRWSKSGKVPARKIWPTPNEAKRIAEPHIKPWANDVIKKEFD